MSAASSMASRMPGKCSAALVLLVVLLLSAPPAAGQGKAGAPPPPPAVSGRPAAGQSAAGQPPAAQPAVSGKPAAPPKPPPPSPLQQAEALYSGTGGRVDEARARQLFEAAAAGGDPLARYRLATLLRLGEGTFPKDPARAQALAASSWSEVARRAGAGDAYAQYLAGMGRLLGVGTAVDNAAARGWFQKAAAGGQSFAMHNLGWMAGQGLGGAKDEAGEVAWYRQAAALGNASSMYDLGIHYLYGRGVATDVRQGERWLAAAADRGHAGAAAVLGGALLDGVLPRDLGRAIPLLQRAAASEPAAQYSLGWAYLFGLGVAQDRAQANRLMQQAAGGGEQRAKNWVRWLQRIPAGLEKGAADGPQLMLRLTLAGQTWATENLAQWLVEDELAAPQVQRLTQALDAAARGGNPTALGLMALLTFQGKGVALDDGRALDLARRGARAGNGMAMRILGVAYRHGRGVREDAGQALDWYRRGARVGDEYCMMWLGHALLDGDIVGKNAAAGVTWLQNAAAAGNVYAMMDLAHGYESGDAGFAADTAKARHYYELAADNGDAAAQGWLASQGRSTR